MHLERGKNTGNEVSRFLQIHEHGGHPLSTISGVERIVEVIVVRLILLPVSVLKDLEPFSMLYNEAWSNVKTVVLQNRRAAVISEQLFIKKHSIIFKILAYRNVSEFSYPFLDSPHDTVLPSVQEHPGACPHAAIHALSSCIVDDGRFLNKRLGQAYEVRTLFPGLQTGHPTSKPSTFRID